MELESRTERESGKWCEGEGGASTGCTPPHVQCGLIGQRFSGDRRPHERRWAQSTDHRAEYSTGKVVAGRVAQRVGAMKVAYIDCFSGVAGDMLLAALLDAVSFEAASPWF